MFVQVLIQVAVVVTLLSVFFGALVVRRERLVRTRREYRDRLKATAPIAIVLGAVLAFNSVARQIVPDISWMIGWNLTWTIYEIEGEFILWLQSHQSPEITAFFSFIYIYGYIFLLVFPVIVYFALPTTRPLRELFGAYTLNYALGLLCYTLIIAYGPRNLMPELVEALLYDTYPRYQHLTRQVNRNTNVFPSLHASLATTVALMAYRTRQVYRLWFVLGTFLAIAVSVSTMYLGIHWVIDVVAGVILGGLSVLLATQLVGRWSVWTTVSDRFQELRAQLT